MAKQIINTGTGPNTNTGDPIRTAFTKVNSNFSEIYDEVAVLKTAGDPQFGAFYDTNDQLTSANFATPVQLTTTSLSLSNTIAVAANTQITFTNTGVYEFSYILQFYNNDIVNHTVSVWLKRNGTNEANTTMDLTVHPSTYQAIHSSYLFQVTGGSFFEIYWSTPNANVSLQHTAERTGPSRPGSPSATVNIRRAQTVFNVL